MAKFKKDQELIFISLSTRKPIGFSRWYNYGRGSSYVIVRMDSGMEQMVLADEVEPTFREENKAKVKLWQNLKEKNS